MGANNRAAVGTGAPQGRTGRPPVTSLGAILAAARAIIDRDGWEKLTIRRLGAEIGIAPTTVYHHVRDKQDLLVQLLNDHIAQAARPQLPASPRDRIVTAATVIHERLATWTWAAEVLTIDGLIGQLGQTALWPVEAILAGAIDHGCTPEQAVHLFRNVWYFTVGESLVRAHSRHRPVGHVPAPEREGIFQGHDSAILPILVAVGDRWPELAATDTFPQGLAALVDGMLAQASSGQ